MEIRKIYLLIIFLLLAFIAKANATAVFVCINHTGERKYQDRPCTVNQELYKTTKILNTPYSKKEIAQYKKNQKTQVKILQKQIKQDFKTQEKSFLAQQKIIQQAAKKQHKCDLIIHKLTTIQKKLQAGYTMKQKLKLDEELDYYKYLKKRYC